MIKAKITKNIIRKSSNSLGLSMKQIIIGISAAAMGIVLYFLLRNVLPMQTLMTIIFVFLAVVIFFGCINVQGQSLFEVFVKMFKGADVRYYDSKGVFSNDISEKKK